MKVCMLFIFTVYFALVRELSFSTNFFRVMHLEHYRYDKNMSAVSTAYFFLLSDF